MALFKNTVRESQTQLAQQMLHNATEVTVEIDNVLSEFLENQEQFDAVSDQMLLFYKKVMDKLSPLEKNELEQLTETITDLHDEYLTAFRMISNLSERQYFRADKASKTLKQFRSRKTG